MRRTFRLQSALIPTGELPSFTRRRNSRELPPDLAELMNKLTEQAGLFFRVFDPRESQLTRFEQELQKIADEVEMMQKVTDKAQLYGAVCGVIGVGIITALPTWGASLVAATGAVVGGGLAVGAYIRGSKQESRNAEKVKHLGEEILEILEPMRNSLEEIKTTCDDLEQKSEELQDTLSDVEELQRILVSELKRGSQMMFYSTSALLRKIRGMAMTYLNLIVTVTPEENNRLADTIISVARQYQKVVCELRSMRKKLSVFTGETAAVAVSD